MARKSLVAKNRQRRQLVDKYTEKRRALKAVGDYHGLQKLPRDASPTRLKNRCRVTGRGHGYLRAFRVSRIVSLELANAGYLPGIREASW